MSAKRRQKLTKSTDIVDKYRLIVENVLKIICFIQKIVIFAQKFK